MEFKFFSFNEKFALQHSFKDQADMLFVVREITGENEDIVKINKDKLVQQIFEHVTD